MCIMTSDTFARLFTNSFNTQQLLTTTDPNVDLGDSEWCWQRACGVEQGRLIMYYEILNHHGHLLSLPVSVILPHSIRSGTKEPLYSQVQYTLHCNLNFNTSVLPRHDWREKKWWSWSYKCYKVLCCSWLIGLNLEIVFCHWGKF